MLNLNKVGRPVCKIVGGKYNGHIVSVSDAHGGGEADDGKTLIKEFKQLNISKDSKLHHTINPNTDVTTAETILPKNLPEVSIFPNLSALTEF